MANFLPSHPKKWDPESGTKLEPIFVTIIQYEHLYYSTKKSGDCVLRVFIELFKIVNNLLNNGYKISKG